MEEREFRHLLDLFPVVRSPDYCDELERGSSSRSTLDEMADWQKGWNEMDKKDELQEDKSEDKFWSKLRGAAERKVGSENADRFCSAFKTLHKRLVYEELSLEAAQRFVGAADS
ncbi:hypothetical protein AXF42_Ash013731 [Apostasia shenzhenica]|uniref:Uncharacterized protein n=1 Tax=Apostasia shenzhenica TaxID=1088818 RepID=A0A2I0A4N5_9ASPA|nr:hypothetical protein AXF42_Ash013731 [Apostasia shenzhenica]